MAADRAGLDERARVRILVLSTDFATLWRDPSMPDRERKRMLRLLIEDVTLTKGKALVVQVRFRVWCDRISLSGVRIIGKPTISCITRDVCVANQAVRGVIDDVLPGQVSGYFAPCIIETAEYSDACVLTAAHGVATDCASCSVNQG